MLYRLSYPGPRKEALWMTELEAFFFSAYRCVPFQSILTTVNLTKNVVSIKLQFATVHDIPMDSVSK
jgi:glycopeptide antibiotics resistance protein